MTVGSIVNTTGPGVFEAIISNGALTLHGIAATLNNNGFVAAANTYTNLGYTNFIGANTSLVIDLANNGTTTIPNIIKTSANNQG